MTIGINSVVKSVANSSHTKTGYVRLYYGPLLLGYEGGSDIEIPKNSELEVNSALDFNLKGNDIVLSPVYHLMDAKVCKSSVYRKQILLRQVKDILDKSK